MLDPLRTRLAGVCDKRQRFGARTLRDRACCRSVQLGEWQGRRLVAQGKRLELVRATALLPRRIARGSPFASAVGAQEQASLECRDRLARKLEADWPRNQIGAALLHSISLDSPHPS
jgi:hypothetical protein